MSKFCLRTRRKGQLYSKNHPFDLVLCYDATGSMTSLDEIKSLLISVAEYVIGRIPHIRISIFVHKDYANEAEIFCYKFIDFTADKERIRNFINGTGPSGGKGAACYELALHKVRTELSWRAGSQRALIIIGDQRPHEPEEFGEICRYYHKLNAALDWRLEVAELLKQNCCIYPMKYGTNAKADYFWSGMALMSETYNAQLNDKSTFQQIVALVIMRARGGEVYETGEHHVPEIQQVPKPTTDPDTQSLFNNTDQVFGMTCPIRGRALIINIEKFSGSEGKRMQRKGSDRDVKELKKMLEAFKFEVVVRQDRTAVEIITDIIMETQNTDHKDYGMFFLCLMSHGREDGIVMGSDHDGVKPIDICDALSPALFPAMAGKPKLIVIQACRGGRSDEGTLVCDSPNGPEDLDTRPRTDATPASTARDNQVNPVRVLNVDDFFILRSSFDSYVSYRLEQSGALLIQCLIKTFYEHACNKDMHALYKMIQQRVREESMKLTGEQLDQCSGQTVTAIDTLSRQRKLYLFPGYNPPPSTCPRGAAT